MELDIADPASPLPQELALLTEEIRIKDARLKRVETPKQPHYVPTERTAILELRAARASSVQQTAEVFLLPADDHASSHANAGRAARPAPDRVRSSPDSPAIGSR
jgi:hypothetical protein